MKHSFFQKAISVVLITVSVLSSAGCFRPAEGVGRTDARNSESSDSISVSTGIPETEDVTETTEADTEPVQPEQRVSVMAVGDNIIHEAVFLDAQKRATEGEAYDFLPMYDGVSSFIREADIAYINHETPLAGESYGIYGYPTFNAPREAAEALIALGFDVINLANNHILDMRVSGARATVEYVQSLPVTEIGAYLDQKDYESIRVTEVNGIRIAWVSFCYGFNNYYDPQTSDIIIPTMDDDTAIVQRIEAAGEIADCVIVSAHWGVDDYAPVTDEQRRLAGVMAEAGADVILGHHPHIIQPVEYYTCADGRKTLVAYSLGNFLSTQLYGRNMVGGMLTFDLVRSDDGNISLENPFFRLTVTHYSMSRDGLQIYMLEDYTEELASAHGCTLNSPEFSLSWIFSHVTTIIDSEFLPEYFE